MKVVLRSLKTSFVTADDSNEDTREAVRFTASAEEAGLILGATDGPAHSGGTERFRARHHGGYE